MRDDKHGAFISGPGFTAFIDGIPDECQHDDDGPGVYFIEPLPDNPDPEACGYYLEMKGPKWDEIEGDSDRDKSMNLNKALREKGYYMAGGAVNCSKCGKPYFPDIWSMP